MTTSAGTDYYVHLRNGDRTITPHMFKIAGRAEYEVAEWKWFFGQGEKPDITTFDTEVNRVMSALAATATEDSPVSSSMGDPVAWWWEDKTGCLHLTLDRPDVFKMARDMFCEPQPLYSAPKDSPVSSLRAAVEGIDDDYMTSENHHPGYVLIPTAKFDAICAALKDSPVSIVRGCLVTGYCSDCEERTTIIADTFLPAPNGTTVAPPPSDGLDDCFRHHVVTTIGWPAFSMRPGREMQMYEEGFKAGYRRCQSNNAEEFGEGEDWFTERAQRVVTKLRESLKAGEVAPLAIDNAVDLLIDQSKALALSTAKHPDADWFSPVIEFFVKNGMLDIRDEYGLEDILSALADNYEPKPKLEAAKNHVNGGAYRKVSAEEWRSLGGDDNKFCDWHEGIGYVVYDDLALEQYLAKTGALDPTPAPNEDEFDFVAFHLATQNLDAARDAIFAADWTDAQQNMLADFAEAAADVIEISNAGLRAILSRPAAHQQPSVKPSPGNRTITGKTVREGDCHPLPPENGEVGDE